MRPPCSSQRYRAGGSAAYWSAFVPAPRNRPTTAAVIQRREPAQPASMLRAALWTAIAAVPTVSPRTAASPMVARGFLPAAQVVAILGEGARALGLAANPARAVQEAMRAQAPFNHQVRPSSIQWLSFLLAPGCYGSSIQAPNAMVSAMILKPFDEPLRRTRLKVVILTTFARCLCQQAPA